MRYWYTYIHIHIYTTENMEILMILTLILIFGIIIFCVNALINRFCGYSLIYRFCQGKQKNMGYTLVGGNPPSYADSMA